MSLDVSIALDDDVSMIAQPYHLYIERADPTKNMARYYAMEIGQTMFGEACLTRRWGRIGRRGQEKHHVFQREEEAVRLFLDLVKQKRARGYRPRTTLRYLRG
ncbi:MULTISPECIES: WGR domain-containing protein [Rhizobium]|uniref:WGR domain-containing protein n=1 Tax=Rhizobium TaxID=379 RepID=UPI001294971B|nr:MULTISPECIES: WGR domain-containing protein [Rhizobium]MBY5868632.1 WGR domain-containing protein [Rhizobium leguminosarum]MQB46084.1 WGR domain-containing protein [Rhizobium sp. ICMP 5592]NKM08006.1 WGR domain-containing protein [Rhizobium leguminosarum bv. viciae]